MYVMIYNANETRVVRVTNDMDEIRFAREAELKSEDRNDWGSMSEATHAARRASEVGEQDFAPVDKGPGVYPRFDICPVPCAGERVSRGFNGDYYPAGTITKVSASLRRVETDDGTVFWRQGLTASWLADATWYMTRGWVDERNPSF